MTKTERLILIRIQTRRQKTKTKTHIKTMIYRSRRGLFFSSISGEFFSLISGVAGREREQTLKSKTCKAFVLK